jgi:hypothetical protein
MCNTFLTDLLAALVVSLTGVPRELFVGNYVGIGGEVGLCY